MLRGTGTSGSNEGTVDRKDTAIALLSLRKLEKLSSL